MPVQPMHTERVTRAIALLRKVHADGLPFDLRDWFSDPDNVFDCGTAACAVGWMVRDEWMQDEGLDRDGAAPAYLTFEDSKPVWLYDYKAIEAFLGVSLSEAQHAFSITKYGTREVTAEDVADRMQGWLDT